MKNEELKKLFKKDFTRKAPEGFTSNLMHKIEASHSAYESLVPRSVFWIIAIGFTLVCALTFIIQPQIDLPFSLQNIINLASGFFSLLIITLVIITLLFLKNIIYYFKVVKS